MVDDKKVDEEIKKVDSKISTEDDESLKKLIKFRKRLTSRFEPAFIVENMRRIIEEDDRVDFFDKRASKFIDLVRPVFKLRIEITKELLIELPNEKISKILKDGINYDSDTKEGKKHLNAIIDYKLMVLQYKIFDPFMTVLFEELKSLEDNKDNKALIKEKEEIYRLFPDFKDLERFFLPSIFKALIESAKGDLIVIEYVQ